MGPGRGERALLHLPGGVSVWLCAEHRGHDFLTRRARARPGGEPAACLARGRLSAPRPATGPSTPTSSASRRPRPAAGRAPTPGPSCGPRPRPASPPGSRRRRIIDDLRARPTRPGHGPPSRRTIARWFGEGRWLRARRAAGRPGPATPARCRRRPSPARDRPRRRSPPTGRMGAHVRTLLRNRTFPAGRRGSAGRRGYGSAPWSPGAVTACPLARRLVVPVACAVGPSPPWRGAGAQRLAGRRGRSSWACTRTTRPPGSRPARRRRAGGTRSSPRTSRAGRRWIRRSSRSPGGRRRGCWCSWMPDGGKDGGPPAQVPALARSAAAPRTAGLVALTKQLARPAARRRSCARCRSPTRPGTRGRARSTATPRRRTCRRGSEVREDGAERRAASGSGCCGRRTSRSVPDTPENAIAAYFPGAAQVDLVGTSGYNFGSVGRPRLDRARTPSSRTPTARSRRSRRRRSGSRRPARRTPAAARSSGSAGSRACAPRSPTWRASCGSTSGTATATSASARKAARTAFKAPCAEGVAVSPRLGRRAAQPAHSAARPPAAPRRR